MNYTKMVMLPMDVYKNLVNADGQQHHTVDAPPPPQQQLTKNSSIKRQPPQAKVIRKILKGMNKKQLSEIVKKNGKPQRKNKCIVFQS